MQTIAHGDVVGIVDSNGKFVKKYNYDAFGNEKGVSSRDTNPFRYCGEWWDKTTMRLYLRARDYDSATGRFTSEDPVRDGLNWYTYCNGDPVNYIDPWGLARDLELLAELQKYCKYPLDMKEDGTVFAPLGYSIEMPQSYIWHNSATMKYSDELIKILPFKLTVAEKKETSEGIESTRFYLTIISDDEIKKFTFLVTNDGVVRFGFAINEYDWLLKNGFNISFVLILKAAAKSLDNSFLEKRSVGGMDIELIYHYTLFVMGIQRGFVVNMGTSVKGRPGYDDNAWAFERTHTVSLIINFINTQRRIFELIQGSGTYIPEF